MYTVEGICSENLQAVFYSSIKTEHSFKPFVCFDLLTKSCFTILTYRVEMNMFLPFSADTSAAFKAAEWRLNVAHSVIPIWRMVLTFLNFIFKLNSLFTAFTCPAHTCLHCGMEGRGIAQLVERPTEKSGAVPTRVKSPRWGQGLFSQSHLPLQTLLRCPYSPRVQSLASTSANSLKIPHTGSHTIVWTHENTAHIGRNG